MRSKRLIYRARFPRIAQPAESHQDHNGEEEYNAERDPELREGELLVYKVDAEIGGHDTDGDEEYCGFGEKNRDACEALDIGFFFDGYELEILLRVNKALSDSLVK